MSGVLHPVGPESAAVYWLRRALVLGVLALVAVAVTALVGPTTTRQRAVPATATQTAVADATPRDRGQASPSRSSRVPAAGSGSGAVSTAARASASPARASATRASATTASAKASRPATSNRAAKPAPAPRCAASQLKVTLKGPDHLLVQQPTTFDVSVANHSARPCRATVTARTLAVTVYSGRDRIWSTRDCASAVGSQQHKLNSQQALTWRLTWEGRRSKAGCKSRPEAPRPGTYVATAQLKGAQPARQWMVLHG